jgi:hypothetical protein
MGTATCVRNVALIRLCVDECTWGIRYPDTTHYISLPLSVLGRNSLIAFLVITLPKFVLLFWLLF